MERIGREFGGFFRQWLLFPARPGAPLVVFLTGTGGTALWADRETGWSELAHAEGFALAVPEALPPDPGQPPTFLTNPPRWNDGSPPLFQPPPADDVSFLTAVIDDAVARYSVDPRRVFVSGFSNGAGMAFRLAAEAADRVAAIAPVAGYCWVPDPRPARPVPTLYTVGANDLLLPLRGGDVRLPWNSRLVKRPPVRDTLDRWAAALGCAPNPELVSHDGPIRAERYPGPVPFTAVTVDGLGHHWPGGRAMLNPRVAGSPSAALNGTGAAWAFFREL